MDSLSTEPYRKNTELIFLILMAVMFLIAAIMIVLGWIDGVLNLILLLSIGAVFGTATVVLIILCILQGIILSKPVLFFEKHLNIRKWPLGPLIDIKYSDIDEIIVEHRIRKRFMLPDLILKGKIKVKYKDGMVVTNVLFKDLENSQAFVNNLTPILKQFALKEHQKDIENLFYRYSK